MSNPRDKRTIDWMGEQIRKAGGLGAKLRELAYAECYGDYYPILVLESPGGGEVLLTIQADSEGNAGGWIAPERAPVPSAKGNEAVPRKNRGEACFVPLAKDELHLLTLALSTLKKGKAAAHRGWTKKQIESLRARVAETTLHLLNPAVKYRKERST